MVGSIISGVRLIRMETFWIFSSRLIDLIQTLRDKEVAKKFFRKPLTVLRYVPRVIIADKLKGFLGQVWRASETCG